MLRRAFAFGIALLGAAATAMALYILGHTAFGISRQVIVMDSFGTAGFLAIACVIMALVRVDKK